MQESRAGFSSTTRFCPLATSFPGTAVWTASTQYWENVSPRLVPIQTLTEQLFITYETNWNSFQQLSLSQEHNLQRSLMNILLKQHNYTTPTVGSILLILTDMLASKLCCVQGSGLSGSIRVVLGIQARMVRASGSRAPWQKIQGSGAPKLLGDHSPW